MIVRYIIFMLILPANLFIASGQVIASGQAQEVRAVVDRDSAALGESIRLSVTIKGEQGGEVDVSAIKDFQVISRGTSRSISIVNGRHHSSITYNYILIPKQEGRLSIPRLAVRIGNQTLFTEELTVQVVRESQSQTAERDLFVEAHVSNAAPFVGEQIIYRFRLYAGTRIGNASFKEMPTFDGLSAKPLEQPQPFRRVISGREYVVHEVPYLLIPLSPGNKTVSRAVLNCEVMVRTGSGRNPFGSIFDDSFFSGSRYETRLFQSEPITVSVKPLPELPPGVIFSGLVGNFDIRAELEGHQVKVGDAVTLSVTVQGTGNIMDAGEPQLIIPDHIRIYKDSPETDIASTINGFQGKKIFRAALAPTVAGEFVIDTISTVFFKLPEGEYRLMETEPLIIQALPPDQSESLVVFGGQRAAVPNNLQEKVLFTGRDILPLKAGTKVLQHNPPLTLGGYLLLLILPLLLWILTFTLIKFRQKIQCSADIMAARAEKCLNAAAKSEISADEFISNIYRALISAIFAKAGIKGEALTQSEAHKLLLAAGCSEQTITQALELLTEIEAAGFSGVSPHLTCQSTLLAKTQALIKSLI